MISPELDAQDEEDFKRLSHWDTKTFLKKLILLNWYAPSFLKIYNIVFIFIHCYILKSNEETKKGGKREARMM